MLVIFTILQTRPAATLNPIGVEQERPEWPAPTVVYYATCNLWTKEHVAYDIPAHCCATTIQRLFTRQNPVYAR